MTRAALNIVVLNDTCEIDGGVARVAIEDALQMVQRGHRVIFFSACGRPPEQNSEKIEWVSLGQDNILQERRRWLAMLRGLWNFQAARALRRILSELPAASTVVHLHGWSKALSGSVMRVAKSRGIPVVCTLHDYFAVCPNGGLYDYPTQQVCTLKPMSMECMARNCDSRARAHKLWRVVRQLIWRYLANIPGGFGKMIVVSAFSERKFSPLLLNRSLSLVDNLPKVERRLPAGEEKRYGMVFAGRVASEKGAELYLQACQGIGLQAEVWGDGPVLSELKTKWPQAKFSGWLKPAEVQSRLQMALALVVPSLLYETYGMVATEAAAAGIAVIVSDHGAAATLVEHGVTGLHFRAGDAADLAAKMRYLQQNPGLAIQMGRTAYDRFWNSYERRREQRLTALEAVYANALERLA